MTVNEYQKLAMATLNSQLEKKDVLLNGVMGLCGESGEAIDIVKKWLTQGYDLDKDHLIKELGDIAWYLAEAATALDVSLDEVFQRNIERATSLNELGGSCKRRKLCAGNLSQTYPTSCDRRWR